MALCCSSGSESLTVRSAKAPTVVPLSAARKSKSKSVVASLRSTSYMNRSWERCNDTVSRLAQDVRFALGSYTG